MDFYQKASEFLSRFTAELDRTGLTIEIEEIDHLCLRVTDLSQYETWKSELSDLGTLLTESYINGRPIAVFKLQMPVKSGNFWVDLIELPAPKSGRSYNFGFEHIEAVSKFPLENLLARRSDLPFSLENFKAPINRDIQLTLDSGLIKFHDQSLKEIIIDESLANEKKRLTRLGIFDFDDTIVKSKPEFLQASRAALSEFLNREVSAEECLEKARQTFPEFFANFNINSPDEIQSVIRIFRDKWQAVGTSMVLPEGIHTLLSCLHSEGVELVVWTARDYDTTKSCLKYLKIEHFFAEIFAFDPVTGSKPKPPPKLEPLTKNRRVALIGDSVTDHTAAKNIGAAFYQAAWIQRQAINVNSDAICESPLICLDRLLSFFHNH